MTTAVHADVCCYRFCQQCGRFQPLSDFKEDRKSCDAALRAHNARRRMMHRDSSSLLQDRPRSISSRSRSRGQPSSEPEQAQNGPAVQRRSARRSSSFRSEPDPNQDLLRAVRRMSGSAGRETRSDGDQARARGSKSPSCSLQTSEEAVQQPQGHEQQPPSTTADAPGSPAAGTQSCQPACWPWSATSMDAAWGVQPSSGVQPGRYELKGFQGIRPIGAAGSSRLGLSAANSTAAASGPPAAAAQANAEPFNGFTPVSFDWLQQQQSQQQQQQQQQIDSTCTLPAYCGSMSISSAPCNTQHQGTLAGWMSQHSWQGAQQMWAAGIGDACSMPVLAQPSTLQHAGSMQQQQEQLLLRVLQQQQQQQACLPLHDSSTLQQHQQQSQDGLTQQVTADTNATSHLKHSGGMQQSVLQQQQPSPLQQQQQQQQQQHHQQQQQEQEQEPTRVQQEQRPSLQQQQQRQLQERIHSPEQLLQGRRHSSQQLQDQSWLDQLLLEFNAGPAPPALDALCPDSAAASTGPLHAANSLARHGSAAGCQAERVDPAVAAAAELLPGAPEDPLADALDLVEVLLAGDPDWQVVQASSAATVSTSTYPATTIGSSTPSSSNVVLNNPSGRLSDLSLVLQGFLPGGCIAMTEAAGQAPAPALLDAAAAAAARAAEAVPLNPAAVAAGLISPSAFGKPHQYSGFFAADAADAAAADSSFPSSAQHRQQPQMLMLPSNVLQEPVAGSMHTEATPTSLAAGSQAHSMPGALLTPLQAVSLGIAALSDPGAAAAAVPASSNLPAVDAQYSHAGYGSDAMAVDLDGTVPVLQLSTQLSRPEQEQPQQSELLSPVQSSALLQQQLELAQQQLLHQQQQQQLFLQHQQQQEQLQLMLRQQQQQTQQQQQQPAAMQHQLVRLSLKLHGVTPDQLPSITVQSMQSLLSRHAGNLDAIMLQPAFRQGCVQTEFDILVKPSWVADTQPLWLQRQQMAASRGDSPPAAAAGVVHDSKASMAWSAVVDALSLCPVTAAAEAQLREALPFRLLLQTLLDLPLVGSSSAEEQHADRHSSSSSSGDRHQMNSAAAEGTVGSRVRSVFAQIGGCMGMWCADGDVLQDWTPGIAGRTVAIEDSSSSSDGVVAGSWRPQVLAAGPLCVAAGADHSAAGGGSWAAGQAWQPLLLDVAVQAGCSDGVYDDTASSGTASSSSTAGSSGRDGVESKPRLWCTRRGLFQPVAGRLEAEASAGAAAAAAVGSPDVIVGLDGALPGLLLLQAEQLNHVSSSGSSALGHADLAEGSGIEGGEDPVPCMSSLVPVVVCPSAAMAAEVEGLLLHAVDSTHAGRLLQQLGLALDCWTLIKQQQQQQLRLQEQHLGLSEREQWCRALLSNQQYLNVIR